MWFVGLVEIRDHKDLVPNMDSMLPRRFSKALLEDYKCERYLL